jgi:hypothetical protein
MATKFLLFEYYLFVCSVKLNNETIKKANLSDNATKPLWRKIKRKDGRNRDESIIDPDFNVSNLACCHACNPNLSYYMDDFSFLSMEEKLLGYTSDGPLVIH